MRGYQLRFHKRSYDGSGKASIWHTGREEDTVWGVVLHLSRRGKTELDRVEGLGVGYTESEIRVIDSAGSSKAVKAYIAAASHVDQSLMPYSWYLRLIIDGATAHGLPASYVEALEATPSTADPDRHRARREQISC